MAATMEQDRHFAEGCYHVNAFFCLSRRFGSTESPCERFIGETKHLFDAVQGPTTTAMVQRLRARTHGLRGLGPDDRFVRTLAQVVFTAERRPRAALAHHGQAERARLAQDAPWLLQMPEPGSVQGPASWGALEAQAAASRARNEPSKLEEDDRALLQEETRPGHCATLPLFAATGQQWAKERQGMGMQPAHPLGATASVRECQRSAAAGRQQKEATRMHQRAVEAAQRSRGEVASEAAQEASRMARVAARRARGTGTSTPFSPRSSSSSSSSGTESTGCSSGADR